MLSQQDMEDFMEIEAALVEDGRHQETGDFRFALDRGLGIRPDTRPDGIDQFEPGTGFAVTLRHIHSPKPFAGGKLPPAARSC